jgi:hypothetical protein
MEGKSVNLEDLRPISMEVIVQLPRLEPYESCQWRVTW